jgi:hemerythrin-like metal-binding protein
MRHMLFIVWTHKYETGIPVLDEQHRGLVSLINSFFFHRGSVDDINRILVPTAEMFKAYAKINYMTVEKLMRDSNYQDIDRFIGIHETMLADIERADRHYRTKIDAMGLLQYLKEYWLHGGRAYEAEYIEHLVRYHGGPAKQS